MARFFFQFFFPVQASRKNFCVESAYTFVGKVWYGTIPRISNSSQV